MTPARSVVCLHGLRRSPADWDGVIAALPAGWEARVPALPADPDQALAVADAAIRAGDVVFAHSLGAVVAQRLLVARPRPVAGLVLTGSFFPPARNGRSRRATVADYLAHRMAFVQAARGGQAGTTRGDGDTRLALSMLIRQAVRRDDAAPAWAGSPTPVLVVHARDDHHAPGDFAIAAAGRHPSWSLALFETGGHHLHVARPGDWVDVVVPWLEAV